MVEIKTHGHVNRDGSLTVTVPTSLTDADASVTLIIEPDPATQHDSMGYSPGFFEATAGAWQSEPLFRKPQGY